MITEKWQSVVIKANTPDGTLYLIVMENDDGTIAQFNISIGKGGSALAAWAAAVATLMTFAVQHNATIEDLIVALSGITSDGRARTLDTTATSGPEGIWQALIRYRRGLINDNDREDEKSERGASVGSWARTR